MLQKSQQLCILVWKIQIKHKICSKKCQECWRHICTGNLTQLDTISNNENADWLIFRINQCHQFRFCPSFCLHFLLQLLAFILDKPTYMKITISINKIIYKTVTSIISHQWFRYSVRNTTLCGSVAGWPSGCKNPVAVQVNLDIHIINAKCCLFRTKKQQSNTYSSKPYNQDSMQGGKWCCL